MTTDLLTAECLPTDHLITDLKTTDLKTTDLMTTDHLTTDVESGIFNDNDSFLDPWILNFHIRGSSAILLDGIGQ